jgi:hypothetical protein
LLEMTSEDLRSSPDLPALDRLVEHLQDQA